MFFRLRTATHPALALALLLAASRESRAQLSDSAHIAVGTRVWVRMRDGTQGAWRFECSSTDSLTIARHVRGGDVMRSVPWSEAERLDTMVVGRASARNMVVGGASGGLLALVGLVFAAGISESRHGDGECPGCGVVLAAPGVIFAGVLTGATVGYYERTWHWATAWRAPAATPPDH